MFRADLAVLQQELQADASQDVAIKHFVRHAAATFPSSRAAAARFTKHHAANADPDHKPDKRPKPQRGAHVEHATRSQLGVEPGHALTGTGKLGKFGNMANGGLMGILATDCGRFKEGLIVKVFTVIGFWPDTHQRFCAVVESNSAQLAERRCLALHAGVAVCGVLAGEHKPLDAAAEVAYADTSMGVA